MDTFHKITQASSAGEDLPKEIKGSFPLGKAPFSIEYMNTLRTSTANRLVALDSSKKKILIYTLQGTIAKEVQLPNVSSYYPTALGVDSQGTIYVAVRDEAIAGSPKESVLKFDSNGNAQGTYIEFIPVLVSGILKNPAVTQIHFDSADNIYFGMYSYHQIRLYGKSSGTVIRTFGSEGAGNGQFFGGLESFTIDASGYLWATDASTQRLQKFKPDGSYDSQISLPHDSSIGNLAILNDGRILFSETENGTNRIIALDGSGAILYSQNGTLGGGTAFLNIAVSIAFSVVGNEIYAGQGENVRVFDRDTGMPLRTFAPTLYRALAVTRDNVGNTFVSEHAGGIKRFDKNGLQDLSFATSTTFYDLHFHKNGIIYAPDGPNKKIKKFSTSGAFLGEISTTASIYHIDISADDIIYASDPDSGLIRRNDLEGNLLSTLGLGKVVAPAGIAVTKDGSVVVCDSTAPTILSPYRALVKINADDSVAWEIFPGQKGIDYAFGVATNKQNEIFVTDLANNNIIKLDSSGNPMTTISESGIELGKLSLPTGITLDDFGNIYVAEFGNHRVQKFNSAGVVQTE